MAHRKRVRKLNRFSNFFLPHIVLKEKKQVWIFVENGLPTTLAIRPLMKQLYPKYESCIFNKEKFLSRGGKIHHRYCITDNYSINSNHTMSSRSKAFIFKIFPFETFNGLLNIYIGFIQWELQF